ncbi:Mif2/CENP-C like-domain-containing protein [Nemania sp. NC0429]|nr:Mif2/CENP-C like-domain-containing protein [Nemania sp. NC0429]
MAPAPRAGSVQRRKTQSQNEHIFALGKAGRKTGLTIPDSGVRDDEGFEVIDDLFSSPDRELQGETVGRNRALQEKASDEPDEQDMEIDDGSELGPATIRRLQQSRLSLPRARSPIKTHLNSPARLNPHVPPTTSPVKGTVVTARQRSPRPEVVRRLDFSRDSNGNGIVAKSQTEVNGASARKGNMANRISRPTRTIEQHISSDASLPPDDEPENEPEEEEEEEEEEEALELLDAGAVEDDYVEEQEEEKSPKEPDHEEEDEISIVEEIRVENNKSKAPGRRGRKPKAAFREENDDAVDAPSAAAPRIEESTEDEEPVKKRAGRPKAAARQEREPTPPADPTPPKKAGKRGRPARSPLQTADANGAGPSSKRQKTSAKASLDDADENDAEPDPKRQKTSVKAAKAEQSASSKPAPAKEKGKPGRKRKSSGIGVDSPMIQRGPPLPKSRGLVTIRREETATMRTTRSGRVSFKPVEYWKGEYVEYDDEQANLFEDAGKRHFKMPTVKGIVRTEENRELAPRRRGRPPTGRKPGRRPSAVVEEEEPEREDWEYEPGHVVGDVFCWKPEHEFEPPGADDEVEIMPEELAISENAIQMKDIKDSTFKFAKTLTLPFFGCGMADLAPGAEKRTKNSRMRHLVFFVHTGHVQVTVARTDFAIGKGGMFFVPRGNEYEIRNETDRPARLFFAQACEMSVQAEEEEA